ncbi:MAG: giguanylate cyclase [Alcanivoracaceae bacterium]|uniref:MHYT domain-containing protein n=1 Tax=Alcanivorax sp. MD8A TaxID=1177157 RepID=UPI000C51D1B4|nr:MHYT domain-containing protein [Alcanivorax sp. MD8A]MAX54259.1 giguanylate cyclase [Alcanivoracaceae bacterium]MCG8437647.1 diguanylate cyclase [Pseudomonadales bacterium]MEE2871021.1 MHYT domain-containing protein [Pseudomonadota bacterium]PNE03481.1 diguanylate cyclase [Alcanivorax sp. MD8A]
MQGSYDPVLVFASYCVAVIAAYIALYFGTRLFQIEGPARKFWLVMGGLCLGSGIWSMHFVGMSAYTMPMDMEMSFDLSLTALSWVPAMLASTLALYVITRQTVKPRSIIASSLIMGAGICAMHYGGMYAMQMHPQIGYDPLLFWISVAIAVGASGAALVICRQVRNVPERYVFITKTAAALVMGAAICGMHYTGMAAAIYSPEASLPAANLLRGDWMGIPMAVVAAVLLLIALIVALQDFREIERVKRNQERRDAWVSEVTHNDAVSGLATRQHFEKSLLQRIAGGGQAHFSVLYLELHGYRDLVSRQGEEAANQLVREAAQWWVAYLPADALCARYNRNSFMALCPALSADQIEAVSEGLREGLQKSLYAREYGHWGLGFSSFPDSAGNSRRLLDMARSLTVQVRYDETSGGVAA